MLSPWLTSMIRALLLAYLRKCKTGFKSMYPLSLISICWLLYAETDSIISRLILTAIETSAVGAAFAVSSNLLISGSSSWLSHFTVGGRDCVYSQSQYEPAYPLCSGKCWMNDPCNVSSFIPQPQTHIYTYVSLCSFYSRHPLTT